MSIRPWSSTGLRLFTGVWLVYLLCPPFLSYDSYWTLATAVNLLNRGTTRVDEFVPSAPAMARYGLECRPPAGPCYNAYPVGSAVLVTPLLALIQATVFVMRPIVPHTGPLFSDPLVAAFFAGDLMGGRPLTELACASLVTALAVWVLFCIARLYLPPPSAIGLALLGAFGTSEWSVASRNLMPHGLTILLLSGALYFILDAQHAPRRVWLAGLLLAISFTVRPSNAISCVVLTLYIAVHMRRYLPRFLAGALPVAVAFFAYELTVRHAWISHYTRTALDPIPVAQGVVMHLFSPSRGLLVFTPVVLVSAAGVFLAWRHRWCWPLTGWLAAIPLLHFAVIAGAWPGHSFGPRFSTDNTHLYLFFLIPAIVWWRKTRGTRRTALAAVFLALAGWGVFVHARGGTSQAANQWSALPDNVDRHRRRVWDWHDPQFLRGLR